MIKKPYILPTRFSKKRLASYAKTVLASNVALALIAIPTPANFTYNPKIDLVIPQKQLDIAFNVASPDMDNESKIQIPIEFTYMSQGFSSFHTGIDLATKFGTPIKPIKTGIVEVAGYSPFGYGNEVLIDNGDGIESLYAHLSKIEVKKGDEVDLNSEIGLVGSTGHSTGPHLHLEIHKNGVSINPQSILPPLNNHLLTIK